MQTDRLFMIMSNHVLWAMVLMDQGPDGTDDVINLFVSILDPAWRGRLASILETDSFLGKGLKCKRVSRADSRGEGAGRLQRE